MLDGEGSETLGGSKAIDTVPIGVHDVSLLGNDGLS